MILSNENILKMRPLNDRILLQRMESEEQVTLGGIFIPDQNKEKLSIGKIISIGEGKLNNQGVRVIPSVKSGDIVFFNKYAGSEVKDNYIIIREEDILAIL